jgi:hypothetical protein
LPARITVAGRPSCFTVDNISVEPSLLVLYKKWLYI